MSNFAKPVTVFGVALVVVLACEVQPRLLFSEQPEDVKLSAVAPQADLLAQLDFFIDRAESSLADYDLAAQSRTLKDANTLAALALVLGQYETDFPEKSSMPALVKAAQQLAAAEGDRDRASQALQQIKTARSGKSPGGELAWQQVASLPILMKQVPLIHASLRRGVAPNRLKRTAEASAGQAAALAAIAQASIFDEEYADSDEDAQAWRKFCADMRDAAGEVNSAVHAQDQARVDAGMQRMLDSCEACHAKFR